MNNKNGVPNVLVAVCPHRPFNFGHVGFGFEYPNGSWRIGAVEGPAWLQGNGFNGFWTRHVKNFDAAKNYFGYMKNLGAEYDKIKVLDVNRNVAPNPKYADQVTQWVSKQKYILERRNCMDSAYDILLAFASGYTKGMLPRPGHNWLPNQWYENLPHSDEIILPKIQVMVENKDIISETLDSDSVTPEWRDKLSENYIPDRVALG